MPVTWTAKRPNKLRLDAYGPDGSIVYSKCYDGTTGWNMDMGQRTDMTEAQIQEFESMATTFFDGYRNYQDKGFTLELLVNEVVNEQNYMVLQVTDKYDNMKKCYINPKTYFIERESGNMAFFTGEWEPRVMTFKDYKMVDGIAFPHHTVWRYATGEMFAEFFLKEVKHNTGVSSLKFM